ncbi:hypothetical protein C8J57DRAFT_1707397 [Mycena rebaudengoi]|nr:hypothetical protein C8J57DRAFT_1707397 [Mycena rebaudengoi]
MSRRLLLLSALAASHAPSLVFGATIPRDAAAVTAGSVQELTQTAISIYLASRNALGSPFIALTGWKTIDWVGVNAAVSNTTGNSILYQAVDPLPDRSGAGSQIFFSDSYTNFIQEIGKAMKLNGSADDNPEIEAAGNKQVELCADAMKPVRDKALDAYISATGVQIASATDPDFLSWADMSYAPYVTALAECQSAWTDYNALFDALYGDDFAIFSASHSAVTGLTHSPPTSHPGINMPIDKAFGTSAPSTAQGNYVPDYSIPVLAATLGGWQSSEHTTPSFTFDSEKHHFESNSSSNFGGAHLGFQWSSGSIDASASHQDSTDITKTSAQSFKLSFNELALMDVEFGLWFDGFRSANALNSPAADNITAAATPKFDTFFGTAEKPGPAAIYNKQALVGYQPSWTIEFSEASSYSSFKHDMASAEGCVLFICGGVSSESSSNKTEADDSKNVVTFTDTSQNGYILGFVQHNFWEESG